MLKNKCVVLFFTHLLFFFTFIYSYQTVQAQCATNIVEICNGSYTNGVFSTFDPAIAGATSCGLGTGNAGFVILNIGTSGTLNVLIDGDANSGFLDVAIFNVPSGVAPCVAATVPANEIACNYAASASGCNGFGNVGGTCAATIAAPTVTAGDRIIIVVDNYSGTSSTFDVQMYDNAGNVVNTPNGDSNGATGADTGPPEADIDDLDLCSDDGATQIPDSADYDGDGAPNAGGGTWSGSFINASGVFDPALSGVGSFTITYGHYPVGNVCHSSDNSTVRVDARPDASFTCPPASTCFGTGGVLSLNPTDLNAAAATNGAATGSWSGTAAGFVNGSNEIDLSSLAVGNYTLIYTYTSVNSICTDVSTTCNFEIFTPPTVTTSTGGDFCTNETTILTATGPCTSFNWYADNNPATLPEGTGTNFTPVVSGTLGTYTYYVSCISNGTCESNREPVNFTIKESPVASLTCPAVIIDACDGIFNCGQTDTNPATVGTSVGSFSGPAAGYIVGDPDPGGNVYFDPSIMPVGIPLTLTYTLTNDGCTSETTCTFTVENDKLSDAGRF